MKVKIFLISVIIYFMLVNTGGLLEYLPLGGWHIALLLLFLPFFIVFTIALLVFIIKVIREKCSNQLRLVTTIITAILLTIIVLHPFGFINWDKIEGKDAFIARSEGVASCGTTFKLKEDNVFTIRNVCFGIAKTKGKYIIINDSTIQLIHKTPKNYLSNFTYAVIRTEEFRGKYYNVFKVYNNRKKEYHRDFQIDTTYNHFVGDWAISQEGKTAEE